MNLKARRGWTEGENCVIKLKFKREKVSIFSIQYTRGPLGFCFVFSLLSLATMSGQYEDGTMDFHV